MEVFDAVRTVLAIRQFQEKPIPFGYPVATIVGKGKKKRKPLGEVAHRERWNQPFE
jgi:hypothetical protein